MKAFSEETSNSLSRGKYTAWAKSMDMETLYVLLWVLGEIGFQVRTETVEARRSQGKSQVLITANCRGSCERAKVALEVIFQIARWEGVTLDDLVTRVVEVKRRGPIVKS